MAMQAGVPIIPVVIRNAHDAMPLGSGVFRAAAIEVVALPPVSTKRWKKEKLDFQISKIRAMFLKELVQEEEADKRKKKTTNDTDVKVVQMTNKRKLKD